MTDDELVDLMHQASADELSDDLLQRLRERLDQSLALRLALRERLWMDQLLAGTLDSSGLSVERLVELARRQRNVQPTTGWRIWAWGICLAVAVATAGYSAHRLGWLPTRRIAQSTGGGDGNSNAGTNAADAPSESELSHLASRDRPDTDSSDDDLPSDDGAPPIVIEAENFNTGNVEIDTNRYGRGIGVIRGPLQQAYFAEYDVPIAEPGLYRLSIRYTSDKPRPLTVSVNGKVVTRRAANGDLQSWEPRRQTWSEIGVYELPAGPTRLRLETEEWRSWPAHFFPHVDKLRFQRVVDATAFVESNQRQRPWERPQHLGGPVRKFNDVWLDDIARGDYTPSVSDMYQWFGSAAISVPYRFSEQRLNDRNCPVFDGWLKFRAPWPADGMLRLALFDYKRLKLHFYRGSQGITLHYFEDRRFSWTAYHSTRKGGNPRPTRLVLAATDEDRAYRTAPTALAPFAIRWHDGELILSRGDVRLLAVALDGPPEEVFLEGRAGFRGLAFWNVDGVAPKTRQRADTVVVDKPAGQSWSGEFPAGAVFQKRPDGSVALSAEPLKTPAWAAMKLPRAGLCEIVVQLDAPVPGAAVYLAGDDGKPADMIRFVRDRRTGELAAAWTTAADTQSEKDFDPAVQPVPFVATQPWLKFVQGCGALKCSLSADGVHWSRPFEPNHSFIRPLTTLGLFCKAGQTQRTIGLRRVIVRELDALQTLAAGAGRPLDTALLNQLLDDALAMPTPLDQQLRVLDDAALIANAWDDHAEALALSVRYRQLGDRLYQAGEKQPYSRIRRANTEVPVWSRHAVPTSVAPLARLELLHAVAERRWPDVERLCREFKFWRFRPAGDSRADELVDWVHVVARRHLPRAAGEPILPTRPEWQPLYEEQLHKQTFNLMAEFQAAVEGQQYRDAAGIVSSISETAIQAAGAGLLPDVKDPDLFQSLSVAVRAAMRDHPELAAAMNEHFGGVAQQRVQRALSEGHAAALEAATLQFHGTAAAAAAHLWLGDRALAVGEFSRALGHYQQAVAVPTMTDRAATQQRARLAAAMLGRDVGSPSKTDVALGVSRFSPAEFEALLSQVRSRTGTGDAGGPTAPEAKVAAAIATVAPKPARYGLVRVAEFNSRGVDPPRVANGDGNSLEVDWFSRQVAAVVDRDLMFVGSRYATTAYDAQTGAVRWNAVEPTNGTRSTSLSAHRLLAVGSRIVRRSAPQPGPTLVALDRDTGDVLWRTKFPSGAVAATDPVWLQNELVCLIADLAERQETTGIALATLDIATGEVLRVRPLVRVQRSWWDQRVGQVTAGHDRLIAVLGGVCLCCDASGQVQWVRRDERIPASVDEWSAIQSHDPPLLAAGRLFVAQPGVRTVEALDPASGRRLWSAVLPDVAELVGVTGGRVIVRTRQGLSGFDPQDGRLAWSRPLAPGGQVLAYGSSDRILVAERQRDPHDKSRFLPRASFAWLDAVTGRLVARSAVEGRADGHTAFGPLIAAPPGRVWLLVGRENDRDTRDLCRLEVQGPLATPP